VVRSDVDQEEEATMRGVQSIADSTGVQPDFYAMSPRVRDAIEAEAKSHEDRLEATQRMAELEVEAPGLVEAARRRD
jgi:hypothetical protein